MSNLNLVYNGNIIEEIKFLSVQVAEATDEFRKENEHVAGSDAVMIFLSDKVDEAVLELIGNNFNLEPITTYMMIKTRAIKELINLTYPENGSCSVC